MGDPVTKPPAPATPAPARRHGGQPQERGITMILVCLLLVPLMIFAAFAVDLAGWYARITDLQRAADAAALAGAPWMPDLNRATTEATASLRSNGIVNGQNSVTVSIGRGSTTNALRVTVTDGHADRYFSQVVDRDPQVLSRSAEAEYNLPLPLGSPLNYFGGDAARTVPTPTFSYPNPTWPSDWQTRVPTNGGASSSCNVSTSSTGNYGRWNNGSYSSTGFSGSTLCVWPALPTSTGATGTSTVPGPDYFTRVPNNGTNSTGCAVRTAGTTGGAVLGKWVNSTFTAGTGSPPTAVCSWNNVLTLASSRNPNYASQSPTNRPCRVGFTNADGWWAASGSWATVSNTAGTVPNGTADTTGNRICTFSAVIPAPVDTTPPNPIDSTRSPGFWAAVEGPQTNAYQGDAYSTRCYGTSSCTTVQSATYQSGTDRGYWYAIRIPTGLSGTVNLRVFDASYVVGNTNDRAGDRSLDGGGNFTTRFRAYRQTNALDFTQRTALGNSSPSTTEGSCYWDLTTEATFSGQWRSLCSISGVTAGQIYLINVQTPGTTGAGVNGYALEAVANGSYSGVQPQLYALSNMAMQNNNSCTYPCTLAPATFYLAEVGPQYAGRTLVMELWDPGDVGSGVTASMEPMRPSTSQPRPVTNVPPSDCSWTASPAPNAVISGTTGTVYSTNQTSDSNTTCLIRTATNGTSRFNGEWLRIRITVPSNYTCTLGINPETTAGSCWWGIRYTFTGGSVASGSLLSANDVTTWQARIEGNPLQLTQ